MPEWGLLGPPGYLPLDTLAGTLNASAGLDKAGGIVMFIFAAMGAYVFAGSASVATGGKPFPLGRPVITRRRTFTTPKGSRGV
jgi:hypothetical protein